MNEEKNIESMCNNSNTTATATATATNQPSNQPSEQASKQPATKTTTPTEVHKVWDSRLARLEDTIYS